jgi:hypothetical protein
MSSNRVKLALFVSIAFNVAVIAAFAVGWAKQRSVPVTPVYSHTDSLRTAGSRCDRFARHMGLCESKAECFKREMTRSSDEEEALKKSVREARAELIMLLKEERPDSMEIMNKVDQISSLQSDLEKLLVGRLMRTHDCLDRDERARFLGLIGCRYGLEHTHRSVHGRDGQRPRPPVRPERNDSNE